MQCLSRTEFYEQLAGTITSKTDRWTRRVNAGRGNGRRGRADGETQCPRCLPIYVSPCLPAPPSGGSWRVLHSIINELRTAPYMQVLHHRILVERNGARREVQDKSNLFHRAALSQKQKHLFLAQRARVC